MPVMDETREASVRNTSGDGAAPDRFYEMTARSLFAIDPVAHCRMFSIPVSGTPEILPEALPTVTLPGDILLVRVAPDRIAHVQYFREVPDDLKPRMLMYHSMITRAYPRDQVSQHVIVLGGDDPSDPAAPPGDNIGSTSMTDFGG
jgi:hypothetical protein